MPTQSSFSLVSLSKTINHPTITILAVVFAVWLGLMQLPVLQYLRPIGEFYISLLQICVLPFLLATIPLAIRSALTSRTGGKVVRQLLMWLLLTIILVMLIAVLVPTLLFHFIPIDQAISHRIGALLGGSGSHVDMEIPLNPQLADDARAKGETGLFAVIPTNIFSALSSNDTLRVIVFLFLFGTGMVVSERRSGQSIYGALRHIQAVCVLIFDWFNLFLPIGIVALVAPQISSLGPDAYAVLTPFAMAFLAASILLVFIPIALTAIALRVGLAKAFGELLKPLALAAATRNTLVCAPSALETMKDELRASAEPCELFIPIGFAVLRFGNMVHFVIATIFIANLVGHKFSEIDLVFVAAFAFMASFATIGVSGLAGLVPLAAVMRPFGLSYELALPLMIIADPIVSMIRAMLNVALNCQIPALAAGRSMAPAIPAE